MMNSEKLESMARHLPAGVARLAKRVVVYPRYWQRARVCRRGYREFGSRYPHPVLFIAGLPKSGTTWLEKMVSSYEGYHELLIPDVAAYELKTGGSHDYELPDDMFGRFEKMLVLTKMHVHGSVHNVRVLREAGVPYVVLFRDLRDVAVSHCFYVRNTNWHPEHPYYRGVTIQEGLKVFAERTLGPFVDWVRSWMNNRDPKASVILRYEQMLGDPRGSLKQVAELFGLDASDQTVERIIEANSFKRMSGGRSQGQASEKAFVRKGVAGDWVNHFTPELIECYNQKAGRLLEELGYGIEVNRPAVSEAGKSSTPTAGSSSHS